MNRDLKMKKSQPLFHSQDWLTCLPFVVETTILCAIHTYGKSHTTNVMISTYKCTQCKSYLDTYLCCMFVPHVHCLHMFYRHTLALDWCTVSSSTFFHHHNWQNTQTNGPIPPSYRQLWMLFSILDTVTVSLCCLFLNSINDFFLNSLA